MGPEAARNLDDDEVVAQQDDFEQGERNNNSDLSKTPRKFEDPQIKSLSYEDRERVRRKEISFYDIKKENEQVKSQADSLVEMALKQEKISETEAKDYRKRLNISSRKAEREDIIEDLQKAISTIKTDKDKTTELDKSDPEIQKAHTQYDRIIDDNTHLLGEEPAEEYKKWIREQKSSIANVEELTIKFFQSERPPRLEVFNRLKETMSKYGIKTPLDNPYVKQQGLSERRAFLKNIQNLEKHFDRMGGMKDKLYSRSTQKTLMRTICEAETPQEQEQILLKSGNLEKQESKGYTTLDAAVRSEKISQKSMDDIVDYYKNLKEWDQRDENLKLWDGFVNNEAKLKDELKDIFDKEPKNEEGFNLAFRSFKHMDYNEKESFIKTQKQKREHELSKEEENRTLAIQAFKQECGNARRNKIISEKTEQNYSEWIDQNSKEKTYTEIKEFLDILTSTQPNEKYKNLKAYEERKKKFTSSVRKLRDVNPLLSEKEADEWQDKYDEEGWKNRDTIHTDLKLEINKALDSRAKSRIERSGLKVLEGGKSKETAELAQKNKETAISAIKGLLKFKAYGSAMKRCRDLLQNNPYDEDVLGLLDEIAEFADGQAETADMEKEKEIYDKYSTLAEKMMDEDSETKEDADEIQTQEQALDLTNKDQQQKKKISAKERNREEVLNRIGGDTEVKEYAEEYLEEGEEEDLVNVDTMKGDNIIYVDFDTTSDRTEKRELRKKIRKEQEKAGEHKGSTAIEFEQGKTGRTIDARSGQEAQLAQEKEKEALAEEMATEIATIMHPTGDPSPEQLAMAKKAALAKLNKKAKTKIEKMSD